MATTYLNLTIESLTCGVCGVAFGLEVTHHRRLIERRDWFYCPNGHHIQYSGESAAAKAERLQTALNNQTEQTRLARVDAQHARMLQDKAEEATRAAKAKVRRVKRGACPDCNRWFKNVADHMAEKHTSK